MTTDTQPDKRRRIDQVLDPEFVDDLTSLDLDELRSRRDLAEGVETELSYYRRLLHGRMDLVQFEMKRRSGEETRSLIEALPQVLAAGESTGGQVGRLRGQFSPDLPDERHRSLDRILSDGYLAMLPDIEDSDLSQIQVSLADAEREVSGQRRNVQDVFDTLQAELTARYRRDVEII